MSEVCGHMIEGQCKQIALGTHNMREAFEFKTWQAFYEFSSSVKYENRYLLSGKSLKFLETLYTGADRRTEIFQDGKVLYRS